MYICSAGKLTTKTRANNLIFGPGLFGISGPSHKLQRKALNPVFTTLHTKSSVGATSKMEAVAQELADMIVSIMNGNDTKEINVLEWCKMATIEIIGQAGFGYVFGALRGNHSPYLDAMRNFLPIVSPLLKFKRSLQWGFRLIPRGLLERLIGWAPGDYMQRLKRMIDTQVIYSKAILDNGKTALSGNTEESSDDILSALIYSNAHARKEERLTEDQLRGQINTFMFAGFETTSSSLARIVHLLAEYPHIQHRLRAELLGTNLDIQDVDKFPYLNAIVREALRLHPPVPAIVRYATKDWIIPLRYPTKERKREIHVKRGTRILISLSRANRNRETWGEDAEEFRPERWLGPLPQSVSEAKIPGVYSSMMTFAAGSRSCIGYKFAVLELNIVLAKLIKTFQFSPGQQSVEWRSYGCISPHVAKKLEDGTTVLDAASTLPLMVSIIH
ncbi:hypothetical protein OPQ81_000593 [Rhizoctonia solani]|nr:hypothetical protein OPQ81_000593 [Rhizoctonia solani]